MACYTLETLKEKSNYKNDFRKELDFGIACNLYIATHGIPRHELARRLWGDKWYARRTKLRDASEFAKFDNEVCEMIERKELTRKQGVQLFKFNKTQKAGEILRIANEIKGKSEDETTRIINENDNPIKPICKKTGPKNNTLPDDELDALLQDRVVWQEFEKFLSVCKRADELCDRKETNKFEAKSNKDVLNRAVFEFILASAFIEFKAAIKAHLNGKCFTNTWLIRKIKEVHGIKTVTGPYLSVYEDIVRLDDSVFGHVKDGRISLSQLRGMARSWRLSVNDRADILQIALNGASGESIGKIVKSRSTPEGLSVGPEVTDEEVKKEAKKFQDALALVTNGTAHTKVTKLPKAGEKVSFETVNSRHTADALEYLAR